MLSTVVPKPTRAHTAVLGAAHTTLWTFRKQQQNAEWSQSTGSRDWRQTHTPSVARLLQASDIFLHGVEMTVAPTPYRVVESIT